MKNSCVIGYGTVGAATAEAFGIDKIYSRSYATITLKEAARCRYIFICLPTPTVNGRQKNEDIVTIINQIKEYSEIDNIFIIRSTVVPGFNRFLQQKGINFVVSNPEFLSEDTAVADAKKPDLIVIGSDNQKSLEAVKGLYQGRFKNTQMVVTDSVTAELIKYTLNTFFALKVIFANEIYDFARNNNANYEVIRKVIESHKWGSKNHFAVWYKDKRGVHGKCLPKDVEAFAHLTDSSLFYTLLERNKRFI